MKRKDKCSNTYTFHFHNQSPKNRYTSEEFCKKLQTKTFDDVTYENCIVANIGGNHIVAIIVR